MLILTLSTSVALAVTDLGTILGIVGATGSTTICFILPGASYWQLFRHPHLKRSLAMVQMSAGLFIMPFALLMMALRKYDELMALRQEQARDYL